MTLDKKTIEDLRMFILNKSVFEVLAQKVAKEEGLEQLTKDELDFTRTMVLRSLIKIAEEDET